MTKIIKMQLNFKRTAKCKQEVQCKTLKTDPTNHRNRTSEKVT